MHQFIINRLVTLFYYSRNKIPTTQDPFIPFLALFFLSPEEARFVATGTSDQTASLQFKALSSIYSVLDELAVSSASNLMGFTKLEEDVFDGLFC